MKPGVFPWQHPQTENYQNFLPHFPHLIPSQVGLLSHVLELVWCLCWLSVAPFHVASSSRVDWIRTHPNLPKLPVPKTLDELQRLPRNLPHVFGFDRQVC